MGFKITILGSSAAVPTKYRSLSSQVLEHNQTLFLIDCGEGSQLQMLKYEIKRNRIDHIFISHLHGDHYLGLPGLLNTMSLDKREKPVNIYAPEGLKDFLDTASALSGGPGLHFPINYITLKEGTIETIFENNHITVVATPIVHRIPTWGFIFREKEKERNINKEFVEQYRPDYLTIRAIKRGADYTDESGDILQNRTITTPPHPARAYAYFSDTMYNEKLANCILGIDTLYHEATFSDAEEVLAADRFHATARQAAKLAVKAQVKQLLLGHISARFLNNASVLEEQAREEFAASVVVADGDVYLV